jgi:hypothetical protein
MATQKTKRNLRALSLTGVYAFMQLGNCVRHGGTVVLFTVLRLYMYIAI